MESGRNNKAAVAVEEKVIFGRIRKVNLFSKDQHGRKFEENANIGIGDESTLARMAAAGKKKPAENLSFQIEVETDSQWRSLLRREGLIVVDVYASWAGPCASMISTLKRVKVEVNDDRLWLSTANSDNIGDLLMFKDQSEPTWLFIGGGKPVKVVRGANAPKLVQTIKAEFERELLCMQGKQKRNLISIDDEVSRRRKAEAEAMRLIKLIKEEEATADDLNEIRRNSSLRLIQLMEPYTVLVIQSFLLESGVVMEIRDALQGDFKVEQERLVQLKEDSIRQLFRIPYKIPDPNESEDFGYTEKEDEEVVAETAEPDEAKPVPTGEEGGEAVEGGGSKPRTKQKKMLTVDLPEGLIGDTLIMLLESVEVRKLIASGRGPDRSSVLQTADDYIQLKVGPVLLKDAVEHAPYSFHALYGRSQYEPGVWCPRRYDDKRYAMVNFFPRFVTDILMPPPRGTPKYLVALYPADMGPEVSRVIETHKKDVLAEGKVKIPNDLSEAMAGTWNGAKDEEFLNRKNAISKNEVYAVSIDRKNSTLLLALQSLDPLHVSFDAGYGKVETSKIFTKLNISIDDMPNPDEVVEKFLARSIPRVQSVSEFQAEEMPKIKASQVGEAEDEDGGVGGAAEIEMPPPTPAQPAASMSSKEPPPEKMEAAKMEPEMEGGKEAPEEEEDEEDEEN